MHAIQQGSGECYTVKRSAHSRANCNYIAYIRPAEFSTMSFLKRRCQKKRLRQSQNPLTSFWIIPLLWIIQKQNAYLTKKSWRTLLSDKALHCQILVLNRNVFGLFWSLVFRHVEWRAICSTPSSVWSWWPQVHFKASLLVFKWIVDQGGKGTKFPHPVFVLGSG
jgi:hypothetical protein